MNGWNHRLIAHEDGDDIFYQIHEVYYNKDGFPESYTEKGVSVGGNTIEGINWVLDRMRECIDKPILWANEKFPDEFNMKK